MVIIIWIKIISKSLLSPVVEDFSMFIITKDEKYIIPAATVTIKRFGPSGSSKKKNIVLEHMIDVRTNIIMEAFFDLKYII